MHKKISHFRKNLSGFFTHFILILICLICILPLVTTFIISMKNLPDITRKPPVLFPCDTETKKFDITACRWSTEGFRLVIGPTNNPGSFFGVSFEGKIVSIYINNTIFYASGTGLLVVFFAAGSGYAFSRYRFKAHRALMLGILAITGVPFLTNLVGLYQMGINLRKSAIPIGDRAFLIFVYVGVFLPLSVWIAKGFFDAIPRDLEEAALIDGCSPLRALMVIIFPLALPGMIAIFLLTFVSVWNEFMAGYLLVAKNEYKPVMFGLYDFMGQNTMNIQVVAAACIVIAIPVILLFLFFRDRFFAAMVEGSVKG